MLGHLRHRTSLHPVYHFKYEKGQKDAKHNKIRISIYIYIYIYIYIDINLKPCTSLWLSCHRKSEYSGAMNWDLTGLTEIPIMTCIPPQFFLLNDAQDFGLSMSKARTDVRHRPQLQRA